tara:strand:+ start:148 stop:426 length:279 start_codon:yes stop_codon:yes gene_type:complete
MKRKHFLQSILGASAFLGLPYKTLAYDSSILQELINNTKKNINGSMFGFSADPVKKVKIGIIGLGNRGSTLLEMLQYLIIIIMLKLLLYLIL